MSFGWYIPKCSYFDQKDVKVLADSAIRIFERSIWTIHGTDEFMEALRNFGCDIDGSKVRFSRQVIDKTLDRISNAKIENSGMLQPKAGTAAPTNVTCATSGQGLYTCDIETDNLREATCKDLADFSRVVNAYPGLDRYHPTLIPQDAPLMTRDLHALVTIMLNSDKPYKVSAYSTQIIKHFVEAYTIYYGSRKDGINNMHIPCLVYINTPFTIAKEPIESAMLVRSINNKPLTYYSMPVVGVMTPVTYSGTLALAAAEVLGINVISLAIDDQVCCWCSDPVGFDMKTARDLMMGPEILAIRTAQTHLAEYFFGNEPSFQLPIYTSANVPGAQSMFERAFAIGMNFLAGVRHFQRGIGNLANADVGSIVQLALDMEIINSIKHMAKGFDVTTAELDEDFIVDTANKGSQFLESENTLDNYRKFQWMPELMNRQYTMAWFKDPVDMLQNARLKARHLTDTAPNLCPLDNAAKTELATLLAAADKELS